MYVLLLNKSLLRVMVQQQDRAKDRVIDEVKEEEQAAEEAPANEREAPVMDDLTDSLATMFLAPIKLSKATRWAALMPLCCMTVFKLIVNTLWLIFLRRTCQRRTSSPRC